MSLEWLTKEHKSIPKPKVVMEYYHKYGGFYVPPDRKEYWIGDKVYYPRETNGLIFVNGKYGDSQSIASTLAHEYRHHHQFLTA